ncbi:MAG: hypothetical protein M0C28_20805 [Candidatus Moduliflexus flocculans]|nr:hypothetical protein [Candidatus Moduliflexus flocculans]
MLADPRPSCWSGAIIALFLKEFVAALMFKHRISRRRGLEAASSALFKKYPLPFIGFGIITFLLILVFVIAVFLAVLGTCCIGGDLPGHPLHLRRS